MEWLSASPSLFSLSLARLKIELTMDVPQDSAAFSQVGSYAHQISGKKETAGRQMDSLLISMVIGLGIRIPNTPGATSKKLIDLPE